MATTADLTPSNGKINFPNMLSTKRRRMRSGGGVSTLTNNAPRESSANPSEEKTSNTSKCKGSTTIPIFLKKTYKMIDTCDPKIASWTPDGEMFVVKDPELFASIVIPQYFDHNKFSSFARQLNFYGFRKMQAKPIRNADYNAATAKHVTFYNEKFKRGRCDLLKEIQRSTRGSGAANSLQDHQREVESLKTHITNLETKIQEMNSQMEERMRRLELDMLGRMEQLMLAMQQNQLQQASASGSVSGSAGRLTSVGSIDMASVGQGQSWDPTPMQFERNRMASVTSTTSNGAMSNSAMSNSAMSNSAPVVSTASTQRSMPAPATLPPHPKQKQLPPTMQGGLPPNMSGPPSRLNSLLGIRGISRGVSGGSTASAVLMRNSWEDKFFSTLMLGETEAGAIAAANAAAAEVKSEPMSDEAVMALLASAAGPSNMGSSALGSAGPRQDMPRRNSDRSLSSVSASDMP